MSPIGQIWPVASAGPSGPIGTSSPCRLATTRAVTPFASRDLGRPQHLKDQSLAIVAERVIVCTLAGSTIVILDPQVSRQAIPLASGAEGGLLLPGTLAVAVALPVLGLTGTLASGPLETRSVLPLVGTADV